LMRVEKREFAWEFSQLSCPGQTRTRVTWESIRVEKWEFAQEFSQLSCPCQTRTRVAWESVTARERKLSSKFEPVQSRWECERVSHPCLTEAWCCMLKARGNNRSFSFNIKCHLRLCWSKQSEIKSRFNKKHSTGQ
jgi:hypothetical protein